MAVWKKVLTHESAVDENDGLTLTGSSGGVITLSDGVNDDTVTITGGGGVTIGGTESTITITGTPANDGILTVQGTGVLGGTGTFSADQAGNATISITHDAITTNTSTGTATTLGGGGSFTVHTGFTADGSGHITDIESTTFTLPNDITVNDTTITIAAGTALTTGGDFTTNQSSPETITINHANVTNTPTAADSTIAYSGTFDAISAITVNSQGHVTGVETTTFTMPASDQITVNDTTGQTGIDLTLASGVLSAVATNLSTTSNVAFANLTLSGDLIVNGNQTILNTETLTVDDDIIVINDNAVAITTQGGFELKTASGTQSAILWNAASPELTGWLASPSGANNTLTNYLSIMEFSNNSTAPGGDAGGVGSFHFDKGDSKLYIRVS